MNEKERLDIVVARAHPEYSRTAVAVWIREGRVLVNGKTAKPNTKITPDDRIEVDPLQPEPTQLQPEPLPLEIIWEDAYLAVIHKEAGRIVHPAPGVRTGTLVHALLYHFQDELSTEGGLRRPGIVHRLDKDTTGLLLIAKDDQTHRALSAALQKREVRREYLAMVHGVPKETEGTISRPIGRSRSDTGKMTVGGRAARSAVTQYRVIERFQRVSLVGCRLETGRTHQIRVHMRSIGHPIVGDPLYGKKKEGFALPYQLLHAWRLGFTHPVTGEHMAFEKEPVDPFAAFLENQRSLLTK